MNNMNLNNIAGKRTTTDYKLIFHSPLIKSFSSRNNEEDDVLNKIVYHYTSPSAFLSIIQSQTLRFTDIRYLNDKSEGIYFVKLLLDFMDSYRNEYPLFNEVINKLLKGNDFAQIKELETTSISYSTIRYHPYKNGRLFVFCACNETDSLNMWNYYVNNGSYQGYNIGLRISDLLQAFDVPSESRADAFTVYYGNVLYEKNVQFAEIKRLADSIEFGLTNPTNSSFRHGDYSFEQAQLALYYYIYSRGPFYKHKKFKSEEEFRFVIEIDDGRIPRNKKEAQKYEGPYNRKMEQGFCSKQGLIVPYLTASFPKQAISRITIAPMVEFDIAKESVRELLANSEIGNVKIYKSLIPIRF